MLIRIPFLKYISYLFVLLSVVFLFLQGQGQAKDIQKNTEMIHLVSPGESLHRIARKYLPLTDELTVNDLIERIKQLSGIEGSLIHPKQRLVIPLVRSIPVAAKTVPKQIDFEARGIYVNRYSMACQKLMSLADAVVESGGNTVILDGKDMTGKLSYPSKSVMATELGANDSPTIGDPAKLIHYLHKRGLHVGVRLVLFYDPLFAEKRPEFVLRSATTGEPWMENGKVAWVDPSQPTVQAYNLAIARELAQMGVDEIQFDYIRFPTAEDIQDVRLGRDGERIQRHQIITEFLAKARRELAAYKVLLSIDVFGIIAWGRSEDVRITGQKIEDLANYCDVISPMIYPSHFYGPFQGITKPEDHPFLLVSETCRKFNRLLADSKVTLRPWIQAFPLGADNFNEEYIIQQLRALRESGARGWLLWSAGNAYEVAWKALAQCNDTDLNGRAMSAQLRLHE